MKSEITLLCCASLLICDSMGLNVGVWRGRSVKALTVRRDTSPSGFPLHVRELQSSLSSRLLSSNTNNPDPDLNHDQKEQKHESTSSSSPQNATIGWKEKTDVVLYRATLVSASIAYAAQQLSHLLQFSNAGLPPQTLMDMDQTSQAIASWSIILSALLAPPNLGAISDDDQDNDVDNALFLLLNESLPTLASFAIFFEIVKTIQYNLSHETQFFLVPLSDMDTGTSLDQTMNLFICAICLREIGFFGAGYKVEGILAIIACLGITFNDVLGLAGPALEAALGLCLLVLAFGKVLEPLDDDLRPNGSAFFRDD